MIKNLYPILKQIENINLEKIPVYIKYWLCKHNKIKPNWILSEIITGNPLTLENSVATKFYLPPLPRGNSEQATSILPTGYTQLDYIESTGTQYIDTGITPDTTLEFDSTFDTSSNFSTSGYGCIFGSRVGSGNKDIQLTTYSELGYNGTIRWGNTYGGNAYLSNNTKINVKLKDNKYYVDNEEKQSITINASNDYNIFIFALNAGGIVSQYGKMKLYTFKLWKNDTLVRDYVPCKNASNEVGLYDLVSQTFYGNSGTETFTAGNTVTVPNPEYPIAITNVTGDVEIVVSNSDNTEEQTFTFPLGTQRMYAGDYLADDGIHHVRKQVVFDGTENWYDVGGNVNRSVFNTNDTKVALIEDYTNQSSIPDLLSSHFIPVSQSATWKPGDISRATNANKYVYLIMQPNMSLADFKTWLSTHNVTVEYELATEEITPYTTEQQQAYDEIKQAFSYDEQTNISGTSSESDPLFEVQYWKEGE